MKKKFLILLLLGLGLAVGQAYDHLPYSTMGEYGFTYDLDGSPSPFTDNSHRPLTIKDLNAPIILIVTNQPAPRVVNRTAPGIGETRYVEVTPASTVLVISAPPITEPAGAVMPDAPPANINNVIPKTDTFELDDAHD